MKTIGEFLHHLRSLEITLRAEGEDLVFQAPKGGLPPDIGAELRRRKPELLAFLKQAGKPKGAQLPPIEPLPRDSHPPLSFPQQRLWFLEQLEGHNTAYNICSVLRLQGLLEPLALQDCFSDIRNRHEVLRTTFHLVDEHPVQIIGKPEPIDVTVIDLSDFEEIDPESRETDTLFRRIITRETRRPFDLVRGPLFRVTLYRLGPQDHVLFMSMHHIVSDGWSMGIINRELVALYSAKITNSAPRLLPLPIQYADYAGWQRNILGEATLRKQLAFWKESLAGAPPLHRIPTDFPRPVKQSYQGDFWLFSLDDELSIELKELSKRAGSSLFMTLYGAFTVLLSRYSGEEDLMVGTPVANRGFQELEPLVGFFVNTLVLRANTSGDPSFVNYLKRLKDMSLQAFSNQDVPFEQMVDALKPERNLSYSPLFQILFVLQNTPNSDDASVPGMMLAPVPNTLAGTKFDLSLNMKEMPNRISGMLEFNVALLAKSTILRMLFHFKNLLASIAANPELRLSEFSMMDDAQRSEVLQGLNDTSLDRAEPELNLVALLERQLQRSPDAPALLGVADDSGLRTQLSYQELFQRADALALNLRDLGVGPESVVAVFCERSVHMVVALLGILRAGGAYMPLDTGHPEERLSYMLADAGASVLITHGDLASPKADTTVHLPLESQACQGQLSPVAIHPENAAYVIYTSGSTGQPKGVVSRHGSISNRLLWMQEAFGLASGDRVLQKTPYTFDVSVWEFFWPLMTGATLVMAKPEGHRDPIYLAQRIAEDAITTIHFVPSMLQAFLAANQPPQQSSLRRVICSGEALGARLRDAFFAWSSACDIELHNLYGPTEAAIDVTWHPCSREDSTGSVPIGVPIANTVTYITDRSLNLALPGAAGELCLGGMNLARGYIGKPALTATRFVPSPFGGPGERLYRTGDLCRFRLDDDDKLITIEYLDRIDFQVKLRGFRIELGEIEHALTAAPEVAQAVVLVMRDDNGNESLTAWLVPASSEQPFDEVEHSAREHAARSLPSYMVPAFFIPLEQLPLTTNGKLNRAALPQLEKQSRLVASVPPRTRTERLIAEIWQDLLGLESVGTADNFFDLGGHSLLLVQVFTRLQEFYPGKLQMTDLFQFPTIAGLAAHLHTDGDDEDDTEVTGSASSVQRRRENDDVAIVGMSFRFPDASDADTFWTNLCEGREAIHRYDEAQLLEAGVPAEMIALPNFVPAVMKLDDFDCFDASFFGMTPKDAEITDPQQRIFLEEAYHALEHAGYDPQTYKGLIGLFAGVGINTYLLRNMTDAPQLFAGNSFLQNAMGNDKDYLTTRVAYRLNLKGPAFTLQSACSTALVGVHTARQSLLMGDCDMALAGGVTVGAPRYGYLYEEGGLLSRDGHCRSFDSRASGTLFGNGAGLVVLKRLDDAIADGDTIYALIKGSAINNDGFAKVGFTAPSVEGQIAVLEKALASGEIHPDSVSYLEAHGTATVLGDPIEVAAISKVYGTRTRQPRSLALGSVKTNLGHLDSASGVAGMIKTVLAMQHRQLPASLHYEQANPKIVFGQGLYVNDQLNAWQAEGPLRAGVSSFGIGGTNAHVILEEAPELAETDPGRPYQLLTWSAKTDAARDRQTSGLADYLVRHEELDLADVAYTLHVGRQAHGKRRLLVCRDRAEAVKILSNPGEGILERHRETRDRPICLMFSGQGSQYVGMARTTYDAEPVFRETVDRCCELLEPHLKLDLRELLFPAESASEEADVRLQDTAMAQPALFVISYALAQLWRSWGIRPQAMIGHSIGEYTAACLAGVFSLEDALALVAARGRLMASLSSGAMLAVSLSEDELAPLLGESCSLAAVNGPRRCVVSGPHDEVEALRRDLASRDIACRPLKTSHAFHSTMMDPILETFTELVRAVPLAAPRLPYLSNVSGDWIAAGEATDPAYWARHLRGTVRFEQGLNRLLENEDQLFIEVGPGRALTTLTQQHTARKMEQQVISSLPHPQDKGNDYAFLLTSLGKLWLAGLPVDWQGFHAIEKRRRVPLPTYPFERVRFWPEAKPLDLQRPKSKRGKLPDMEDWFYIPSWKNSPLPPTPTGEPATVLLFADEVGLALDLSASLEAAGHSCVSVSPGEQWQRLSGGGYRIDPCQREHYEQLLGDLTSRGLAPGKIVHAWSVTAEDACPDTRRLQELGFLSIIFLAQALGSREANTPLDLLILANHLFEVAGQPGSMPAKATLIGPQKVIPQEMPGISCRLLDLDWKGETDWRGQRTLEQLRAEILAEPRSGQVALRGNQRLEAVFERHPLQPIEAPQPRQNGCFLITGGLGGIGFTLAGHLARTVNARLVLTGRSAVPPREQWDDLLADENTDAKARQRIERLRELEEQGAQVLPLVADAADEVAMRRSVETAETHFGTIHGVIHSAGMPSGGIIQLKTVEQMWPVLAPKVEGTLILDRIFAEKAPDFMLLCSSVAGVTGGFGQVDYCAANAFMDIYADTVCATRGWNCCSVNWDAWLELGMAAEAAASGWSIGSAAKSDRKKQASSFLGIEPDEGIDAFERILANRLPRTVVSVRDLYALQAHMNEVANQDESDEKEAAVSTPKGARPELETPFVAPSTEVEEKLAAIWQECLGIAQVGVRDSFFDLGGDSLLATQIISRVRRALDVNISMAGLFDEPTILGLAELIEAVRMAEVEEDEDDENRERGRL